MRVNEVYWPYMSCPQRMQIFFGGAASGKSTFLAQRCVWDLLHGGRNYLVVRAVARTLRQSVWNQVLKAVRQAGAEKWFRLNQSEMCMTCTLNGGQVLFAGMDDPEKLKSITPERGVLTDVWAEEATELEYAAFKQLTKRLRGREAGPAARGSAAGPGGGAAGGAPEGGDGPAKRVCLSFNPMQREHWIWREFFRGFDEKKGKLETEDLVILRTTFRDNCFLTGDDQKALLAEKDKWYYDIYTEGRWASPEGAVFHNWRVEDLGEFTAEQPRWGLDFGFAADPNALLGCQVDMRRKKIVVFAEMVQGGLHDDELAEELKKRVGSAAVVCDCAEPKAISDLCRRGLCAVPAVKGPDSVRFGLRFLQGFEMVVDRRCVQTAEELAGYRWQRDKNGNMLPRPEDKNNHLMDALRYAVEDLMLQSRAEAAKRL